jgi:hypothetical protein
LVFLLLKENVQRAAPLYYPKGCTRAGQVTSRVFMAKMPRHSSKHSNQVSQGYYHMLYHALLQACFNFFYSQVVLHPQELDVFPESLKGVFIQTLNLVVVQVERLETVNSSKCLE